MKAKRRDNGEIIEVTQHGDTFIDENGNVVYYDEIDIIVEQDWSYVRIQAAIAAMQGLTSNPSFENHTLDDVVAECVTLADALIAELQKGD